MNCTIITSDSDMCKQRCNSDVWTVPRVELREALQRIAPYLAETYEGAVALLYQCPVPGRARLIAHAVREIGNALPEKISGQSFPTRFDPTNHLDALAQEWSKCGFPTDGCLTIPVDSEMNASQADRGVYMPRKLFGKLSQLIIRHSNSRISNKGKAVELFKACDSQNPGHIELLVPILEQWLNVVQWFVGIAHDRSRLDHEILQGKLPAQFDLFEAGLRALTTDFFGTVSEELDEILENANS